MHTTRVMVIVSLLATATLAAIGAFMYRLNQRVSRQQESVSSAVSPSALSSPTPRLMPPTVPDPEKQQIDSWLVENNLNQYGDPKDRMYAGGTPLFNERTGETTDRYDYIISRHPEKPWNTQ